MTTEAVTITVLLFAAGTACWAIWYSGKGNARKK
jgi:hypothetical protein